MKKRNTIHGVCFACSFAFSFLVPSGPPYATIQASSNEVSGGDMFNITCTVLGEPEMDVKFRWTYPGQVNNTVFSLLVI